METAVKPEATAETLEASLNKMRLSQSPINVAILVAALVASIEAVRLEAEAIKVMIERKAEITKEMVKELVGALRKTGPAGDKLRVAIEIVLLPGVTARKGEDYQIVLGAVREAVRKSVPIEDIVPTVARAVSESRNKEISFSSARNVIKGIKVSDRKIDAGRQASGRVTSLKTASQTVLDSVASIPEDKKAQAIRDLDIIINNATTAKTLLLGESK